MKLKIKKLVPEAIVPSYATPGSACFDLHAVQDGLVGLSVSSMTFRTGIAVEVPEGHVMLVFSRSGHGFKSDIRLSNCTGIIDSDYRGEVMVKLRADSLNTLEVMEGDRIAQAMVIPVQQCAFDVVENLSSTGRGTGGFGSTGR